jgi:hypothetical protein
VILGWLTTLGCGGALASVEPPDRAVGSYVQAIRSGAVADAYALLDADTRAEVSMEEFAALVQRNQAELQEQTGELERVVSAGGGVEARARLPLHNGETVVLILEDGRWRVDGGVLGAPTLRTPRDAVVALRTALARRSLRGITRVLAREPRAEVEAEIEQLLEDTADELDFEIEIRGNSARVSTSSGREILLIREAGEWRILELR